MKQLGAQDAQFLHAETANALANVVMIFVFDPADSRDGKPDFEDLVEHVTSRMHASPIYRRRLQRVPFDLDYPYWVNDEHFDVGFQVEYSCLPKPGTWQQFTRFVSKYHSKPMDMNRPLWEMCMVDGLDAIEGIPKGCFAIVVKVHHSALDGISGQQFFATLLDSDKSGTPAVDVTVEGERVSDALPTSKMLGSALLNNIRSPVRLMEAIARAAPGLAPLLLNALRGGNDEESAGAPQTRFNAPVSPLKHFDTCWFPLSDFKRIKASVDSATINDLVLAVCGGALREYLQAHDELPQDSLVAWVPINARPRGSGPDSGTNQITGMTVSLFTDITDPRERLTAITTLTRRDKVASSATPAKLLIELTQHVPAYTMALATRLMMKTATMRMCNLMITNVPGPQVPVYLRGSKCIRQFGIPPVADRMGLCIATPSYNGEIAFTVTSSRDMVPDIEFFIACVKRSLRELEEACELAGRAAVVAKPARRLRASRAKRAGITR